MCRKDNLTAAQKCGGEVEICWSCSLENYEYSVHESCKQDFVSPNSLMLDDILELEKAKQIASAEKQVS